MQTKRAYTLGEVISYLESLEMLNMAYSIEKHPIYYDLETERPLYNVWIIEYQENKHPAYPETAIEFED